MSRIEFSMKRGLHEGFPMDRNRFPTGEKDYKGDVDPTQLNLLRRALEKCGLQKVSRTNRYNPLYRKHSDRVVELYNWPSDYKVMDERLYADVTIRIDGTVDIEISAYDTFPKSLSKMFRECGFKISVSLLYSTDDWEADGGNTYDIGNLENAPIDRISMSEVSLKNATLMFGKLSQHLPKAQAQYIKDTRNPDGSLKTSDQYNVEKGILPSGNYQLTIDWENGKSVKFDSFPSDSGDQKCFGTLADILYELLEDIGESDNFIEIAECTYDISDTSKDLSSVVSDYIQEVTPYEPAEICEVGYLTIDHIKGLIKQLIKDGILEEEQPKVMIDEVNMNDARAKRVAKDPQRAVHFENRQRRGKFQKVLRESQIMADIEELKIVLSYIAEDEGIEPYDISREADYLLGDLEAFESEGSTNVEKLESILNDIVDFKCDLYKKGEDSYCDMLEAAIETTENSIEDSSEGLTESEDFNYYNPNKRFPKIHEDIEFGKDLTGKIQMKKISNGYKSTYATNKNAHGLTPDTKITTPGPEEKKVAKAVYDILKKKGKDKDISQKFNISPRPDLVMKGNDDVLVTPDNGKEPYTITNDEIEAELDENVKSRRARYNYHRF